MYLVKLKLLITHHHDVTLKYGDELFVKRPIKPKNQCYCLLKKRMGQKRERQRERWEHGREGNYLNRPSPFMVVNVQKQQLAKQENKYCSND